jgi:hypothetical protein
MNRRWLAALGLLGLVVSLSHCAGPSEQAPDKEAKGNKADRPKKQKGGKAEQESKAPTTPVPTLLVVQAQFAQGAKPLPAKLVLFRYADGTYYREEIEDPESNVFHKAIPFDGGILTIGAMKAKIKVWKRSAEGWKAETMLERSWGGKFDRWRDIEIGDVNGDGQDEIVLASHDQGVVSVGTRSETGWTFVEMDQKPDTFVHEIEIGDVDGDGKKEFYATPSERNRASGESQPGSVYRYDLVDGAYVHSEVVAFTESHAKEILVTDTNGDNISELYVVREAHTVKSEEGVVSRVDPVRIVQFTRDGGVWSEKVVATLDDDQCRFLLAGDVDGDGKTELIAAGKDSGLWMLERKDDGTFENVLIDANSGGFEHATHIADLDGDGKLEIYVAADTQKEFRRYTWTGTSFDRKVIAPIGSPENSYITWNLQHGVF